MKNTLFKTVILTFFSTLILKAQYRIELNIRYLGSKDKCYLVHAYRDEKTYIFKDTADVKDGKIIFEGKDNLPQGLYSLAKGQSKMFDFVLVDQKFSIETDTLDIINNMKIFGSKESSDFAEFVKERIKIMKAMDRTNPNSQQEAYQKVDKLTKDFVKNHSGQFSGNFMKATISIDLPQMPPNPTRKDTLFVNNYYFKHYFDNIDLADDRLIKTPIIDGALDYYIENVSYSEPDTIIKYVDEILAKTKPNSDFRKVIIMKFGQAFIAPKLLERDKVYIHIAEKYIIGEPNQFDSTTVKTNVNFVKSMKPLLIGNIIPNAYLTDTLDKYVPLHSVNSKYTLFVIYDPKCGHCQDYTKTLVQNFDKLKAKGITIYMACHERNKEEWKKFIKEYKTEGFINVFDSQTITDFTKLYNSTSLPVAFLLDKNKKILSNKRLEIEGLERMVEMNDKLKLD
jgi:peroxiredoxin